MHLGSVVSSVDRAIPGRPTTRRIRRVQPVYASHTQPDRRVVITGLGLVSAFGNDVEEFHRRLCAGESAIKPITKFDVSKYSTRFAGEIANFDMEGLIDAKSARRFDDCLKYISVAGKKALADAGLDAESHREAFEKLDKSMSGVLIGTGMGGLTALENGVSALVLKGAKKISPFFIPYSISNMGGALLAIDLGFHGPTYSISTACATGNYTMVAAATHIRRGEADLIVAGGAEAPILPIGVGGFIACRALSSRNEEPEKASRPWDKGRDGFVMGEGCGALVMESLDHAMERGANIICEYLGGATNCDAYHMTDPRPDGSCVKNCMLQAIEDAGIDREMVNYVNAHATSTKVGDMAEANALKDVFPNGSKLTLNGTKSIIGHALGGASALEAIATVQAIRTSTVHPTLNQDDLEEAMDTFDTVPHEMKHLEITAAMSNSFGFGGHNSAVIFAPFKE